MIWLLLALLSAVPGVVSAEDVAAPGVTIFFTGYVRGNYEPCGCRDNPSGGLARRAGYINRYRENHQDRIINVELGSYFTASLGGGKRVNELMLDALRMLPVHVFHLNGWDLERWPEISGKLGKQTRVISSNIIWPPDAGKPPARFAVRKISLSEKQSVRFGFLGLTNPRTLKRGSRFRMRNPLQTLSAALEKHGSKADYWIILSDLTAAAAKQMAQQHPQVIAVLLMSKTYKLFQPQQVNQAVILHSVERGRYLGKLRLGFNQNGKITSFEPELINLNEEIRDDEKMARRIEELKQRLKAAQSESE